MNSMAHHPVDDDIVRLAEGFHLNRVESTLSVERSEFAIIKQREDITDMTRVAGVIEKLQLGNGLLRNLGSLTVQRRPVLPQSFNEYS